MAESGNDQRKSPARPPVAPYLTVSPASAAIAFYGAAFGAIQKALMPSLDGRIMHCELSINGGTIMLADMFPEFTQTRTPLPKDFATVTISLEFSSAKEVDDTFTRVTAMGAREEIAPSNTFWGTRFAVLRDPFGHRWMLNGPAGS